MVRLNVVTTTHEEQPQPQQQQQHQQHQQQQEQTQSSSSSGGSGSGGGVVGGQLSSNNVANSTSSSTTSLNSNASTSSGSGVGGGNGNGTGIVMIGAQQQQQQTIVVQQQQQQQPQQHTPSDASSTSSLPASPPLLQQTPTPPQGAQIVPPMCAVHNPHTQQQHLAIVAAMHQAAVNAQMGLPPPPPPGAPHMQAHHLPQPPPPQTLQTQQQQQQPTTAAQQHSQQQHLHENGHMHIISAGGGIVGGGGISPSGSTGSSVSSSGGSGGGGCTSIANGVGGGVGTTIMTTAAPPPPQQQQQQQQPQGPPPPPPGPLYIQYPGEFYSTEYYLAPHPHEGICPQHHPHAHAHAHGQPPPPPPSHAHHPHPHHHQQHQPMCAMSAEYGPTTVQMVSQNRPPPPLSVPVQVPPYVNENGTLTHVMLSPQQYQQLQHAAAGQGHLHAAPFLTTNGTSHFYTPLPGYPPPGPAGNGPPPPTHYHMTPQATQPPPQQTQSAAAQQQQQQQQQTSVSHSPHSPSPPNSYRKDERTQRQHTKLLRKLEKQRELNSAMSTPTHSPSPRRNEINGHHNANNMPPPTSSNHHIALHHSQLPATTTTTVHLQLHPQHGPLAAAAHLNNHLHQHHQQQQQQQHVHMHSRRMPQRNGTHVPSPSHMPQHTRAGSSVGGASSVGTSEDGEDTSSLAEDEEDCQASIVDQLSAIEKPEVIDVTSRAAKIIWVSPSITDTLLINMRDLRYNVLLSDTAKQCKYKSLYRGEAYECIVQDLQPGQDYRVRLQVHYQKLQGNVSEPTEFRTPPCEPDQPQPPKLASRTKNSLSIRWTSPAANGAPIQHYLLECDEGKGGHASQMHFVEVAKTKGKHYTLSKLQPTTIYSFRLAAVNEVGQSLYSEIGSYSTSGNPPTVPKPPTLQAWTSSSLRLVWERRAQDSDFHLQLQDPESGHGYLNMYNGPENVYECCQLRRATTYLFRLRAENEAGISGWSHEVSYKTLPEHPGRPGKPHVKGKIHGTHFKARWDPPLDTGGAEILRYFLDINAGPKFERIYTGADPEANCERLQPGTTYQLRASCEGPAGLSSYSEIAHITTEAVVPAAPPPPYCDNPPAPYAALLRLSKPDYNGGAPVLEYEAQLRVDGDPSTVPSIIYRGKQDYCVVQPLKPGGTYELQSRAINRIGAGSWSQPFRFTAAAAPPDTPQPPKVLVKSATHMQVSWQPPVSDNGAPITEYRLESATMNGDADESSAVAAESTKPTQPANTDFHSCYHGLQTIAELRNLLPYTRYYFRLLASNVAGPSQYSPVVDAKTPAAVPAAPQIQDYEFTANEVTLNWIAPACNGAEISSYNIEYADRSLTTPDACTKYTISGLTPETNYKIRVQAVNAVGNGAYSAFGKFTTLPAPPLPPKLECTGAGHNYIKLKWREGRNIDFTKYYVEMYVQRAKQFQQVYAGTNCMCKVHKLQERTAYTFRIYAHTDRAGAGDYSEEYVFETTATLPSSIKPPRVAYENGVCLLADAGSATGAAGPSCTPGLQLGVQVTLEWQHSKNSFNDRVEYELQYALGSGDMPAQRDANSLEYRNIYRGPETKFTIDNLAVGTCYQFRVCPVRITQSGELLHGQASSALRYQVPQLSTIDDIDGSLAAGMLAAAAAAASNGAAIGNCQHLHAIERSNAATANATAAAAAAATTAVATTQHKSRQMSYNNNNNNEISSTAATLHHRSVSASAIGSSSSSSNAKCSGLTTATKALGGGVCGNQLAIGLIPLGSAMANDLATNFATCNDPLHHHHHHHHHQHQPCLDMAGNASTSTSSSSSSAATTTTISTASLLAATASGLLLGATTSNSGGAHAHLHHNHHLHHAHHLHHTHHSHSAAVAAAAAAASGPAAIAGAHNGAIRRFMHKLSLVYTNRKRFTDQEKAVIFMVSFFFFTFLFATLVNHIL